MDNNKESNEPHCLCDFDLPDDHRFDVTKTTKCPYCGSIFDSSRELLVHIFAFHAG
ncbi:MAG: hypothetical protein JSV21_11045 [Nitrospirota bacterium]|nr:MAG: hypothetical protein JSV21_11045 [Nitrospirota bacterium]